MLHFFKRHAPYEDILDQVFCLDALKRKLRKIWKKKSYNIICTVMLDNDQQIENHTLYDTLYVLISCATWHSREMVSQKETWKDLEGYQYHPE